jgi:hypothetical protein
MSTAKLVIARYNENIDWILDNNLEDRCIVYNKSPIKILASKKYNDINSKLNIKHISNFPSFGREGHTYLKHITENYDNLDDYTIFSQADPFEHSPDFINVIRYLDTHGYKDYQPLSCYWLKSMNIPPQYLVDSQTEDYVGEYPIRLETCDKNLFPIEYYDNGIFFLASQYRNSYRLRYNQSIVQHFEETIGIKILPEKIKFSFGAIFGLSKELIMKYDLNFYHKLLHYVSKKGTHGYVLERMWYSIFKDAVKC